MKAKPFRSKWTTAVAFVVACALVSGRTRAASNACQVAGAPKYLRISVNPGNARPFALALRGIRTSTRLPPRPGAGVPVGVEAPLEFVATTRDPRFYLAEPVDAARGMAYLSSGTELMSARARGADAVGSVQIAPSSTTGVTVRDLSIPCASLTLTTPRDSPAAEPARGMDTTKPIQTHLWLREQPSGGAFVEIDVFDRDSVRFHRLSHSGQMVQVESSWSDGSRIRGWIPEAILRVELASSWGAWGANSGSTCTGYLSHTAQEFVTVAAGTNVFDRPAGEPWASVPTSDVIFEANGEHEGEWVRIVGIPGITDETACEDISYAWVPRGAVTLAR